MQFCYQFSAAVEDTQTNQQLWLQLFFLAILVYDVPEGMAVFEEIPQVPSPCGKEKMQRRCGSH